VVGATGLQGRAVTRRLLQDHWPVRALTRNPDGKKARAIAQLGAEVIKADMADPASLERAFDGVHGVFSVQNHHLSGYEGEVRQGKHVAEVAKRVGVPLLVYSGAGPGVQDTALAPGRPSSRWRRTYGLSISRSRSSILRRSWS
jgi:uncharacterized protein YbjT (DUF2867 family)